MPLKHSAEVAVSNCLNVQEGERFLVITDPSSEKIGQALFKAGVNAGAKAFLIKMQEGTQHGEEPPEPVADLMKTMDVIIAPTKYSISHTQARREANEAGVRMATMPSITEEMFGKGGMSADFIKIQERCDALFQRIKDGKTAQVTTELGTHLTLDLEGRTWIKDTGVLHEKGAFGNLPAGEIFLPPVEGTAEGTLVVDGAMAGWGKLKKPIHFEIKEGRVVSISGGREAKKISEILEEASRKLENPDLVYNIAELGIGLNPRPGSSVTPWRTRRSWAPSTLPWVTIPPSAGACRPGFTWMVSLPKSPSRSTTMWLSRTER